MIDYIANDKPQPDETGRVFCGYYRVTREGFVALIAHYGHVGTVSMWPMPLDDPEVVEWLEAQADLLARQQEGEDSTKARKRVGQALIDALRRLAK
jgi:hypothetical protein